jgi:hypothetical protein
MFKNLQVLSLVKILFKYVLKSMAIHNGWPRLIFNNNKNLSKKWLCWQMAISDRVI